MCQTGARAAGAGCAAVPRQAWRAHLRRSLAAGLEYVAAAIHADHQSLRPELGRSAGAEAADAADGRVFLRRGRTNARRLATPDPERQGRRAAPEMKN